VESAGQAGLPAERVVLMGFSQGGCLALEYGARNARRYGGLVGLSSGLIGPQGTPREYGGSLAGTPVFLGCSDIDSHIPEWRVHESTEVLRGLGGEVTERIYPRMGHTINDDEIGHVRRLLQGVMAQAQVGSSVSEDPTPTHDRRD
jgi:phospholipase/carboxylesterase